MPRKKAAPKEAAETTESNSFKGKVVAAPKMFRNSQGVISGLLVVSTEEHEKNVNCFFNDPKDLKLYSFQEGDELEVEVKQSGQYFNGTVITPSGTASDPNAVMEAAKKSFDSIESHADKMGMLMSIYRHARFTVEADDEFMDSIEHLREDYPDIYEETIRATSSSLFIEFNRKNFSVNDLVPFE